MLLYKTYINKVLYNSNSYIEYTLAFTEIHMDCIEPACLNRPVSVFVGKC